MENRDSGVGACTAHFCASIPLMIAIIYVQYTGTQSPPSLKFANPNANQEIAINKENYRNAMV